MMTMSSSGVSVHRRTGCEMGRGWRAVVETGLGDARTRVLVGFLGRRIRPRVLFRVKSVALLTTISVPVTIAYDLWTAFGEWYFITRPFGVGIRTVLEAQVPFTLYHLLSSLIFVPLFGSIFLFLHAYGWPARTPSATVPDPDRE